MSKISLQYRVLGVLLVAGIAGALVTPLGGDPRIGAFSAGITFGVLIAIYVARAAELKSAEKARFKFLSFHDSAELPHPEPADQDVPVASDPVADEPVAPMMEPVEASPVNNIVEFTYEAAPVAQRERKASSPSKLISDTQCSCACGCEWRAKDAETMLCGNCRRWSEQQAARCSCDYASTGDCTCGAIKHRSLVVIGQARQAA